MAVATMRTRDGAEAVSIRQAARILGLSRQRVQYFVRVGRLPGEAQASLSLVLIPLRAIRAFQRLARPTGRPRKRRKEG